MRSPLSLTEPHVSPARAVPDGCHVERTPRPGAVTRRGAVAGNRRAPGVEGEPGLAAARDLRVD
ncbi:hypothetical protein GCM10009530_44630 [Microbispora corallina]|uniref:Uncharacterized protein n=1 Tax=Microbispora corallina TaxID=83302 RepID=A0ABQ4FWT3_9ACTN|nr:hypothetical protein Mco01_22780 [Microbispora corallina]